MKTNGKVLTSIPSTNWRSMDGSIDTNHVYVKINPIGSDGGAGCVQILNSLTGCVISICGVLGFNYLETHTTITRNK